MDRQQILEFAKTDPQFSKAVLSLENKIGDMPITGEALNQLVKMLELALNHPDKYPEIVKAAVEDDMIEAGDLPEQFDPVAVISLLVLLYGMQERTKQKGFAKGGLASLGRHGDTMLAHINPREADILKRLGGSGTINPQTGYPEYFSLKKFLAIALPIALNFLAPGLGVAIGSAMGLSGAAAAMVGGAVVGGGTAALTGGDPIKGALLGGLGGGFGNYVGGAANSALGLNLGATGQNVLGGALVGGGVGAATGDGFLKGAASGAVGSYVGQQLGNWTGNAAVGAGGRQFGNMLTAGYSPKSSVAGGALAGLAAGFSPNTSNQTQTDKGSLGLKPSDAVVQGLRAPQAYNSVAPDVGYRTNYLTGETSVSGPEGTPVNYALTDPGAPVAPAGYGAQETGGGLSAPAQSPLTQLQAGAPKSESPFTLKNAVLGATALSVLSGAPSRVQDAVKKMSPEQQEYFNRPSISWDWDKLQDDASTNNVGLAEYMSRNWPKITSGAYNQAANNAQPAALARGGALSALARVPQSANPGQLVQGAGAGRDDTINAKLSDGEYVMDAETVALLGDGSNKAGAKRLDAMRGHVRAHKGRVLAQGRFSPDAKAPLSYLKEVA